MVTRSANNLLNSGQRSGLQKEEGQFMSTDEQVSGLIQALRSRDGVIRQKARTRLVSVGKPAVPFLITLMSDPDDHVRWEACKTLGSMKDPSTITILIHTLLDDDMEVRWLAAEGLILLQEKTVLPLLEGLRDHIDSVVFRWGAYHVLHALEHQHRLDASTIDVLRKLKEYEPTSAIAWSVHTAIGSQIVHHATP
jgi:HEAT repeats